MPATPWHLDLLTTVKYLEAAFPQSRSIPRSLSEEDRRARMGTCVRSFLNHEQASSTNFTIAHDENPDRKLRWLPLKHKSQTVSEPGDHVKKQQFFCSTGSIHRVYYEVLPEGTTLPSAVFCATKRTTARDAVPSPCFAHYQGRFLTVMDNIRPHHAIKTKDELETLGIIWLPHPSYSPGLSTRDYHAFSSLEAYTGG